MPRSRIPATILVLLAALLGACGRTNTAIRTLDDATHAKLGVMTGTTGETIAKSRFPQAEVQSFHDAMDAVAALKAGQIEGVVTSYPTAVQVGKKNPGLRPLDQHLAEEDSSVAMRKGSDELLAAVNRIIAELKQDGTLEAMKKRWFKQDSSPYEERAVAVPTSGTPLRIGVSATREPMNFVDQEGRVTGHDGELARIIAAKLGRPIEFSNMKFMALIPALQSGKIDMIVTGMTATKERAQFVDFSAPYFQNAQVMLVRSADVASAAGLNMVTTADIADKRVGVMLGSAHDTYAVKTYPKAKVLQFAAAADLALAIKAGKIDAALYDEESLNDILRDDPSLGILGESLFSFKTGVGFNKSSTELHQSFNRFLTESRKNGVYADMIDRWITKRQTRMPDLGTPPSGNPIVAGISTGGAPFTFIQDNALLGFDIEMLRRFGASVNRDIKFLDMEFGALVAAVASGKVDLIAASIYITPERQKLIDFSDPYYEMGNRVFGLKANIAAYAKETAAAGPPARSFFDSLSTSFRSNIVEERRYLLIFEGLKTTAILSVCSTVFGTLLGALVCFLRMSRVRLLSAIAKVYISILRGTPVLVLLMLIFYVVFASVDMNPVFVAVIAFGMNFAAYVSEIFRTGIEGIDPGQGEAGIAMGFSRVQTFLYVVLPQTVRRILPVYKGEFISLVKMTSIVGYIAVQDLTKASDIIRSRTFDAFFPLIMVALLYFSISWLLMQSLEHLERVTDPKYKRAKAELA